MIGLEMPEIRITLPVARPEDAKKLALYQQVYGQQVSFGTQQAEFWFDEWVLNVPIPSADLMTFNVYADNVRRNYNVWKKRQSNQV